MPDKMRRFLRDFGWVLPTLIGLGLQFRPEDWNDETVALAFFGAAGAWFLISLVTWVRRPRIKFGCVIENDSRVDEAIRYVVRLHATTRANVGQVEAHLVAIESGFPSLTTSLPLGWSNQDEATVSLDSGVPRSILLGFVDHRGGSREFVYYPAGPGFPDRHLHAPIRTVVGQGLVLHVRLVQVETRRWWHSTVQLAVPEGLGLPLCSTVLEWSLFRRLWSWLSALTSARTPHSA